MLLVIDIGNTNITLGVYDDDRLVGTYRLTTSSKHTSDEYGFMIGNFLNRFNLNKEDIEDVVIASVVPKIMHSFTNAIRRYLLVEPLIVSSELKTGLTIDFENPHEVGADRIVDAIGAHELYQDDLLVVDFGTATTFELITKDGVYHGGCICPGVEIMSQALSSNTAKLPEIEIKPVERVIAKNTSSAMQAGVYFGYIGLVEKIIEQFKKETKLELKVIATGGLGRMIYENSSLIDIYNRDLTFEGLRLIYEMNKEMRKLCK